MTTSDSGVIDLFAIHKEEEARRSTAPPPMSAPPPPVSLDVSDEEISGYVEAQSRSRRKAKIIGGVVGCFAVIGIVLGAIAISAKEDAKPTAAAEPPPPAVTAPPPPAVTAPAPVTPTPAPTPKATSEKPDYTPATAAAAYANSQRRPGRGGAARAAPRIGAGVKLQKIQSSGVN